MRKEIGGYFELEVNKKYNNIPRGIVLNCARNCLRYIVRVYDIKEIFIPYYTCPVVLQALKKENCEVKFYHIDKRFMPTIDFEENAYILYTNYFGICAKNVKELALKYKNLIIDNAQAFYMPKYGIASFNSVRKFFGVPDGAFLYCDKYLDERFEEDKNSINRFSHLLKRLSGNCSDGYIEFQKHEKEFEDENIKEMSCLTKALIRGLDIDCAKERRLENFNYLHSNLLSKNELKIKLDIDDVPMVYPFLIKDESLRQRLINDKIYVAKYWDGITKGIEEQELVNYLLPLPIDQRYCEDDMKRILEFVC